MTIEYVYDIGWTEAQEMNTRGWEIIIKGYRENGRLGLVHISPCTDKLTFNDIVRGFIIDYNNIIFNAKNTGNPNS